MKDGSKILPVLVIFVALLCPYSVPAEGAEASGCVGAEACYEQGMMFYQQGDSSRALVAFKISEDLTSDPLYRGASLWMSGKILARQGVSEAEAVLKMALFSGSPVPDYIQQDLCLFTEGRGDDSRTAACYLTLYETYPASPLRAAALMQAAKYFKASGDLRRAEELYHTYLQLFPDGYRVPFILNQLALSALGKGRPVEAGDLFRRLWVEFPATSEARKVEEHLKELHVGKVGPDRRLSMSFQDRFQRARRLFDEGHYEEAAGAWSSLLATKGGKASEREEARFKLARTYQELGKWELSEKAYSDYRRRYPKGKYREEALYHLGTVFSRWRKEESFVKTRKTYLKHYPGGHFDSEARFGLADYYADKGDVDRAKVVYRQLRQQIQQQYQKRKSDDSWLARSLWEEGWLAYRNENFHEAIRLWEELPGQPDTGYEVQAPYWIARSYENLGLMEKSNSLLQDICQVSPHSYYCVSWSRETQVHHEAMQDIRPEKGPVFLLQSIPQVTSNPLFPRIQALHLAGLKSPAAQEARTLIDSLEGEPASLIALARLLSQIGDTPHALGILQDHFPQSLIQGGDDLPSDFWLLAYPGDYRDIIMVYARQYEVDPNLVSALIREESWFNPQAVSAAGAKGLMQMMPGTARILTAASPPANLYDPEWNIALGTRFVSDLLHRFQGDLVLTIAAYNAGPGAVDRWLQELPLQEKDEFIESIPYGETRRYVKRVLRSYAAYQLFY